MARSSSPGIGFTSGAIAEAIRRLVQSCSKPADFAPF
jgi:hypothetical protein